MCVVVSTVCKCRFDSFKEPEIFSEGSNEDVWFLNLYQVKGLQVFHLLHLFLNRPR